MPVPPWRVVSSRFHTAANCTRSSRVRGFYEGGGTSGPSSASVDDVFAGLGSDGASTTELLTSMLTVLRSMDNRLQGVESWSRELRVVNNLQETRAGLDELKQVEYESAIRPKIRCPEKGIKNAPQKQPSWGFF
jgi:hypothetical protein